MSNPSFTVRTPCRLHFGLLAFGEGYKRRFGGVGAMLSEPSLSVRFEPSDRFRVSGLSSERVSDFAKRWSETTHNALPSCSVIIESMPESHRGLGSGTQLGLATAAGLSRFCNVEVPSISTLALSVGRGRRSAVGSHGFQHGGIIVDDGKDETESLGELISAIRAPESWRVILVSPAANAGLSGDAEEAVFDRLPSMPLAIHQQLRNILQNELVPAANSADLVRFGESVYEYGRLAGSCFATAQSGCFASPLIEQTVELIRSCGVHGVGQSSWGPTVFSFVDGDENADRLIESLKDAELGRELQTSVSAISNGGATIQVDGNSPQEIYRRQ